MADIPRLNGVIKALEQGQTAFVAFTPVDIENAVAMASSKLCLLYTSPSPRD